MLCNGASPHQAPVVEGVQVVGINFLWGWKRWAAGGPSAPTARAPRPAVLGNGAV